MSSDIDFVEENARELGRLRGLVARLSGADLAHRVTPEWNVADVLGHVAFWDARALQLALKLHRGEDWNDSDYESEDVEVLNRSVHLIVRAVEPRRLAELAVELAGEVDALVATLPRESMWPYGERSPLNCLRAAHRGEHLDEIEAALARRG